MSKPGRSSDYSYVDYNLDESDFSMNEAPHVVLNEAPQLVLNEPIVTEVVTTEVKGEGSGENTGVISNTNDDVESNVALPFDEAANLQLANQIATSQSIVTYGSKGIKHYDNSHDKDNKKSLAKSMKCKNCIAIEAKILQSQETMKLLTRDMENNIRRLRKRSGEVWATLKLVNYFSTTPEFKSKYPTLSPFIERESARYIEQLTAFRSEIPKLDGTDKHYNEDYDV